MKTKQPTSVTYRANVIGIIWQGCRSTYSYSEFDKIPTAEDVRRKAGDFQLIEDYEVIETRHSGNWNRETTKRRVVREWSNPDSEDYFFISQECA